MRLRAAGSSRQREVRRQLGSSPADLGHDSDSWVCVSHTNRMFVRDTPAPSPASSGSFRGDSSRPPASALPWEEGKVEGVTNGKTHGAAGEKGSEAPDGRWQAARAHRGDAVKKAPHPARSSGVSRVSAADLLQQPSLHQRCQECGADPCPGRAPRRPASLCHHQSREPPALCPAVHPSVPSPSGVWALVVPVGVGCRGKGQRPPSAAPRGRAVPTTLRLFPCALLSRTPPGRLCPLDGAVQRPPPAEWDPATPALPPPCCGLSMWVLFVSLLKDHRGETAPAPGCARPSCHGQPRACHTRSESGTCRWATMRQLASTGWSKLPLVTSSTTCPLPWPLTPGKLAMFPDPCLLLRWGAPGVFCRNGYTRVPGAGCWVGPQSPLKMGAGRACPCNPWVFEIFPWEKERPQGASRIPWGPYLSTDPGQLPKVPSHGTLPTTGRQGLASGVSSVQGEQQ